MTVELFTGSGSPYGWRAQLALEIKGVPYVLHMLSFSDRHHKAAAFLEINPRGRVPVLKHGDYVLTESTAIVGYIDAAWPEPPLYGATPRERGRILESVATTMTVIEPLAPRIYRPIFWAQSAPDGGVARAETDGPAVRAAADELHGELARIEADLVGRRWVASDALSAADVAFYPVLQILLRAATRPVAARFELGLLPFEERYPRMHAWAQRIAAIPGFDRTFPPHWRGT